jgi:3-phosphoshikimate 1-carboxyvinyltransferase
MPPTILAVLSAAGSGEAVIDNIEHLANKESDRINRTAEELRKTGVRVEAGSDRMILEGEAEPEGPVTLSAHGDHRLAMAFSILGLLTGNVVVEGVECVAKSYPTFYEDLRTLGGSFDLTEPVVG